MTNNSNIRSTEEVDILLRLWKRYIDRLRKSNKGIEDDIDECCGEIYEMLSSEESIIYKKTKKLETLKKNKEANRKALHLAISIDELVSSGKYYVKKEEYWSDKFKRRCKNLALVIGDMGCEFRVDDIDSYPEGGHLLKVSNISCN